MAAVQNVHTVPKGDAGLPENSFWSDEPTWQRSVRGGQPHLAYRLFLILGLSFFWSLIRHARIVDFIELSGLASNDPGIVLGYYSTLIGFSGAIACTIGTRNLWQSRRFGPLCLAIGFIAGLLMLPSAFGASLAAPIGYGALAIVALATSLLAVQCVILVAQSARSDNRTPLICVFGSTLASIVETFLLSDVLGLDNGGVLYLLLAAIFLYAASRLAASAPQTSTPPTQMPLQITRGHIHAVVGVLALVTFIKAMADTAFPNEDLRLTKHLVGILELSLILITISAAKGTGAPLGVAFYILLGSFVGGTALASMPASTAVVHAGIATITSARVLAETLVLVFASNMVATNKRGVFRGAFLYFILPEMLACAAGYGILPLLPVAHQGGLVETFRCIGILSSAAVAIGTIAVLGSHDLTFAQAASGPSAARQPDSLEPSLDDMPNMAPLVQQFDLTAREALVGYYLYRGYSAKRISTEEGISINTVQSHSRNLYRKLGIHSRQELVELIDAS